MPDPVVEPTLPFQTDLPDDPTPAPTDSTSEPTAETPSDTNDNSATAGSAPSDDTLLDLKQQAITQLGPLVDQLDQTPEEKFRTTMMLIQSTDNPQLIQEAYEAAQAISDEKVRAQALLDVINEINYFTQSKPEA